MIKSNQLFQQIAPPDATSSVMAVCCSVTNAGLDSWRLCLHAHAVVISTERKAVSSLNITFLYSKTAHLARDRHKSRQHRLRWRVRISYVNKRRKPISESTYHLRMVCLDISASISAGKWRRIDNSNMVGVNMSTILIAWCLLCIQGPERPEALQRLIMPSLIHWWK